MIIKLIKLVTFDECTLFILIDKYINMQELIFTIFFIYNILLRFLE